MPNHTCPLCGDKTVKDEMFCRNCQDIAKKSSLDALTKNESKPKVPNAKTSRISRTLASSINVINEIKRPVQQKTTASQVSLGFTSSRSSKTEKDPNRNLKIMLVASIFASIILTYVFISDRSQAQENAYWAQCIDENTSLRYAGYLQEYPQGEHSAIAEGKLRELKEQEIKQWYRIKGSNDINAFRSYLEDYPNTPYIKDVKNNIDRLAWLEASDENTEDAYRAYLDNIKLGNYEGGFRDEAQKKYAYFNQLKTLVGNE